MNKQLQKKLQDAVKDFGLSEKAIEALVESASKGVADDASDEAIDAIVANFKGIAKAMQGEVTRKVQESKSKDDDPSKKGDKSGDGKGGDQGGDEPDWFKKYRKEQDDKYAALKKENDAFKSEKAANERKALISAKAKELGIPEFLMNRVSLADDADIEKELTDYKQELVNNSLLPKETGGGSASEDKKMQEDAESWAKSLPDA